MSILRDPFALPAVIFDKIPQANHNLEHYRAAMDSGEISKSWMDRFFSKADLIFLLYPDSKKPGGLGMLLGKGQWQLEKALAEGRTLRAKTSSFIVGSAEEAYAAGVVHGDLPHPQSVRKSRIEKNLRRAAAAAKSSRKTG